MRLAYIILAYKNFSQLSRLLKSIYHPDNIYLLHIDKKAKIRQHNMLNDFKGMKNFIFLSRQNCWWGGISFVDIHIRAMRYLYDHFEWQYLINLSGQDLPLRSQRHIMHSLQTSPGLSYIEAKPIKEILPDYKERLNRYYLEIPFFNYIKKVPLLPHNPRLFNKTYRLFAGSSYFILEREFCHYILHFQNLQKMYTFYRYSFIPEESFFQTILLNSHLKTRVCQDNKREINWHTGPEYPRIFRSADYDSLIASKAFFARKFDENIDNDIIDRLINRIES